MAEKIFPFLWIKGDGCNIEQEIKAIKNAGVNAFCVESRVHPDFCGDGWWDDMDKILACAQKYGMEVWILDDKSYPTGIANDTVITRPELRKWQIAAYHYDVVCDGNLIQMQAEHDKDDEFLAAWAIPNTEAGLDIEGAINISDCYRDKWIFPALSKGVYRIVVIVRTRKGYERANFIDVFNSESVDLLISEVYEKHYERYKEHFGKEIMGFFSDEPRFGNGVTQYYLVNKNAYESAIGVLGLAYPYSEAILEETIKKAETKVEDLLALWYPHKNYEEIRVAYMDAATKAYAENFSRRIGLWCKEHGVMYAGHIIEDMNAHVNTGCSCGHYFRSQEGQDFSGIDVVLHQIKPFSCDVTTIAPISGGYANPNFFMHTLPALAVSDSILDKSKQGALCELFGAYGWGESARDMKWIVDTLLSAGVKYFIPHAFSSWNDNVDCPPHFYEGNTNPEYQGFCRLMEYIQNATNCITEQDKRLVGVLYHAEMAWTGHESQPIDDIVKQLDENQIPCLIVPSEQILSSGVKMLIVPEAQYYPKHIQTRIAEAKSNGILVINAKDNFIEDAKGYRGKWYLKGYDKGIRILQGKQPLIFRTSGEDECVLCYDEEGDFTLYDPMNDKKEILLKKNGELRFSLQPGETRIILREKVQEIAYGDSSKVADGYSITCENESIKQMLQSLNGVGALNTVIPDFSGSLQYSSEWQVTKAGNYEIEFQKFGGTLALFVDGRPCGVRIGSSARYRLENLSEGIHQFLFTLSNTLANEKRDELSRYDSIKTFGLLSLPTVRSYE